MGLGNHQFASDRERFEYAFGMTTALRKFCSDLIPRFATAEELLPWAEPLDDKALVEKLSNVLEHPASPALRSGIAAGRETLFSLLREEITRRSTLRSSAGRASTLGNASAEDLAVAPEMTYIQARQIVSAYGDTLVNKTAQICDESALPFRKATIKQALLMVLPFAPSSELRTQLKQSYLYLADFQAGLGDKGISLPAAGGQPSSKEAVQALAKEVAQKLDQWTQWFAKVEKEALVLAEELRIAGFNVV